MCQVRFYAAGHRLQPATSPSASVSWTGDSLKTRSWTPGLGPRRAVPQSSLRLSSWSGTQRDRYGPKSQVRPIRAGANTVLCVSLPARPGAVPVPAQFSPRWTQPADPPDPGHLQPGSDPLQPAAGRQVTSLHCCCLVSSSGCWTCPPDALRTVM